MSTTDPTAMLEKLTAAIRQDPKKAGVLACLGVVLAVMLGRVVLSRNAGPARASAAGVRTSNNPQGSDTKSGTSDSSRTSDSFRSARESFSERTNNLNKRIREWMADPVQPVSRNLFAVKLEYYPVDGSRPAQSAKTAADGEFWGKLEKSLMVQADQKDKRDILLANYKTEASKLRLDSIIMGDHPKAMIDGKLVAEGDVVAQFRVLKIEPRRITIEREGIRLEIQMK